MKKAVIIVAGGTGTRMNAPLPKQFLLLGGRPLLMYSLEAFYRSDPETQILVVLPDLHIQTWKSLCNEYLFMLPHTIVNGGESRFHSVSNALCLLRDEELVAIHDGARPLVTSDLIGRAFSTAFETGSCVPAIAIGESMRVVGNGLSHPVNRADYRIIQTPQVFWVKEIQEAYKQDYSEAFTDDATVYENSGKSVRLIEGEPANIKITRQEDLIIATCLLNKQR